MFGYAIAIATIGIFIMAIGDFEKGSLFGLVFGLISALGFSIFSVSLKMEKGNTKIYYSCFCRNFLCNFFILYNNRNSVIFFIIKFKSRFICSSWNFGLLRFNTLFNRIKKYTSCRTNTFIFNRGNRWNILGLVTNTWNK